MLQAQAETQAERVRLAVFEVEISKALTQSASLPDMLHHCTEAIVQRLDAAFARIWTLNEAENVLELRASAGRYTHLDGVHSRIRVGEFKIGRIAQTRQPHLTNDVLNDPHITDPEWARQTGMVAFAGYPLMVEGRLIGVMALFGQKPLGEFVLHALGAVANLIALGIAHQQTATALRQALNEIEQRVAQRTADLTTTNQTLDQQLLTRKQSEDVLQARMDQLRALLDVLPDLIIVYDRRGIYLEILSGRPEQLPLPREAFAGKTLEEVLPANVAQQIRNGIERVFAYGDSEILHYELPIGDIVYQREMRLVRCGADQALAIIRDISAQARAETDLRSNQALLQQVGRAAKIGIWELDVPTLRGQPSEEVFHIYELPPANEIGWTRTLDFYASEARPLIRAAYERALREGAPWDLELPVITARGHRIWVRTIGRAVRANGKIVKLLGTLQDITERKQLEAEQAHLLAILEGSPDFIATATPDGHILYMNPAGRRGLGYDEHDDVRHLTLSTHRPAWTVRKLVEEAIPAALRDGVWFGETALLRGDGVEVPLSQLIMAHRDGHGQVAFLSTIARDISERKRAEQALRSSEAYFRTMADSVPIAIGVMDADANTTYVNRRWCEFTGTTPEQNLGRGWLTCVHPADREVVEQSYFVANHDRTPLRIEYRVQQWDGEYRWVIDQATPRFDDAGDFLGHIGCILDITERKRTEEALQEREAMLRTLGDNLADSYLYQLVSKPDGSRRYTYVSAGVERSTGLRAEDILRDGSLLRSKFMAEDTARDEAAIREAIAKLTSFDTQVRRPLPSGEVRWLHIRSAPRQPAPDGSVIWDGIALDITEQKRAEEALREREAMMRTLGDNLPNGYLYQIIIGPGERRQFTFLSAGVERATGGIRREDALANAGLLVAQIVEEDRARLFAAYCAAADNQTTLDIQFRLRWPSGEIRWVHRRAAPRPPLPDGAVIWDGIELDITEQKRAEEALRESDRRYRALFAAATVGIALTDWQGIILEVNQTFANMLGYAPSELIGLHIRDITHPDDWTEERRRIYKAHETSPDPTKRWFEKRYAHRDGHSVWVRLAASVLRDSAGQPWLMTAVVQDVTAIKQTEEELLLRNRALEAVSQGVVITDCTQPDHPIIYVNQGFEQLTGYAQAEALGRNCRFLQGPNTDPETVEMMRAALRAKRPCLVEVLNYRKDGQSFWNALSIAPIRDATDNVTHFAGVLTDITSFKRLEAQFRQAQKMEAVGRLAGGLAHDFNNILTVINGYSELVMARMPAVDPLRSKVEQIHAAGERAAGLTRQLLIFSRNQMIEPVVFNLNTLVLDMEKMLSRLIGEHIQLITVMEPTLRSIKADPGQVEQIMMNLAVNARDAMAEGGQFTISTSNIDLDTTFAQTHPEITPGAYVLLRVSDTGHGMDETTKAHLFEPFFTTKAPGKGTGLGLATVYGIVRQSGGAIDVESEQGRGTTFRLFLPESTDANGQHTVRLDNDQILRGGTETILLVEDDEQIRAIASLILDASGYSVLTAANGHEALHLHETQRNAIDLLVTDVIMPGMSGRKLSDLLLSLQPNLRVLFVSGYTDAEIGPHGVLEPEKAFLPKPYTLDDLVRKVREVLDR